MTDLAATGDVIDSFIPMTQDPRWGMPARVYLDNGSEYGFAEFLSDALTLSGLDCEDVGRGRAPIRATACNAAAEGILKARSASSGRRSSRRCPAISAAIE